MLYFKKPLRVRETFLLILGTAALLPFPAMAQEAWTLETAVSQAIQSSPEMRIIASDIEAQKGELLQAGAYPNPTIGITGSNKMGKDDGKGGSDLTQYSVTQPIPLGRLSRQKNVANAELQAKTYEGYYQRLVQENKAAMLFHRLQYAEAKLNLAREQLSFAKKYSKINGETGNGSDPLIRYTSELDNKRLELVRDVAEQEVEARQAEFQQAKSNFASFLNLPLNGKIQTKPLSQFKVPKDVDGLLAAQKENHAAIVAAKSRVGVADASISVAKAERYPDLGITFFRERDILDDRRQDFNGVMLTATVPLWDQNKGNISKSQAQAKSARHQAEVITRDLQSALNESYIHLKYLRDQANSYQSRVLKPAENVLDLTKKSFASDEVQILSLIDANNSYFDAREQYLGILYEGWVETANMRLLSGQPIAVTFEKRVPPEKPAKSKKKPKAKAQKQLSAEDLEKMEIKKSSSAESNPAPKEGQ